MTGPLYELLPRGEAGSDELLGRFLDYVSHLGLTLYPAQEDAILALFEGHNVILNTPTGSGKSLVASALHFMSLAHGRRCCTARSKSLTSLMPVAESPGAVRIGHPERGHLVEYLAPNSVFNSLPRQRSCSHLRPDDRFVTIDRVLHHASLGEA